MALWTIPTNNSPHGYEEGFINFRINLKLQFDKFFSPKMSVLVQEEKEKDVASLMENRIISFFLDSCQTVNASIGKVYKAFYEPMQTRHDFAKNWNCWLLVLA